MSMRLDKTAKRAANPGKETTAPASAKCTEAAQVYHAKGKPVPLEDLMDAAGIELHKEPFTAELWGFFFKLRISPTVLTKHICVNANHRTTRQRFSAAHELAHAAHFAVGSRPDLCSPNQLAETQTKTKATVKREQLCDRIAAEVLMPADLVLHSIFAAGGVVKPYTLARQFDVSITAMRVRHIRPRAIVI